MNAQRRLALLWALVVCLLVGHNAWLWFGKGLAPDTDILALLPSEERDPVLQQSFTHMVDSAQQRVVVLVGAKEWDEAGRAADAYRAVLSPHGAILSFDAMGDDAQAGWLAGLQRHGSLLLGAEQERQLRKESPRFWVDSAPRHGCTAPSRARNSAPSATTPSACSPAGCRSARARPRCVRATAGCSWQARAASTCC
ncbi:hypothetical protein [Massilia sp. Se16.2.3]|uniref:hypothetical protein n=1 Tax=Massilia sp. Se16.2.3 TaxID=2709303 RepID=UPI002805C525|nr:hypothetical protein [Massilia sp. Se16.2.3]